MAEFQVCFLQVAARNQVNVFVPHTIVAGTGTGGLFPRILVVEAHGEGGGWWLRLPVLRVDGTRQATTATAQVAALIAPCLGASGRNSVHPSLAAPSLALPGRKIPILTLRGDF